MISWELEAAATLIYDGTYLFQFDTMCLEKGELINDAVIDFYLKYLNRVWLNRDQRQRIRMCESVFLDNIAENVRNGSKNQLNLMEKDYMIMPTRLEEHWFLVVLCYARNVIAENFNPAEKPEILIFDSAKNYLSTKRSTFLRLFRSLIKKEFAMLLNISCKSLGNLTEKLPLVIVPTQQQDNDVDCGVFLMENVERFLNDRFELPAEFQHKVPTNYDPDCFIDTSESKRENIKDLINSLASSSVTHFFN